jgi:hypothetical protein
MKASAWKAGLQRIVIKSIEHPSQGIELESLSALVISQAFVYLFESLHMHLFLPIICAAHERTYRGASVYG